MAAFPPRPPTVWFQSSRMSQYVPIEGDEDLESLTFAQDAGDEDVRTPLDKTIDRIGMGSYQWTLLSLCGFGWMADNMWIQAIAIILPRVQQHYSVGGGYIGLLSSSMFAGMMFGAVGWGTCSDLMGRTTAFNATLFLTSVFGVFASFAPSFVTLCIALFLLGSAVGGSMPTDGTLLLEHMPTGKQYLVTALSVFFSLGSVLSAVVGLLLIPNHSCPPSPLPCDISSQNKGWQYLLIVLGAITMIMFVARMVFFRLHESPRYLVHAGRPQEAVDSLQLISRFNGSELPIGLDDVEDRLIETVPSIDVTTSDNIRTPFLANYDHDSHLPNAIPTNNQVIFDSTGSQGASSNTSEIEDSSLVWSRSLPANSEILRPPSDLEIKHYSSMAESTTPLETHAFVSPSPTHIRRHSTSAEEYPRKQVILPPSSSDLYSTPPRTHHSRQMSDSSLHEIKSKMYWKLPRWIRHPLWAWFDRIAMVLSPEWLRTTILVWIVWCSMSLGYTMFNVYLPKLLEGRSSSGEAGPKGLNESLWDVVIYSLGGCPGAILGAYLVESPLGRRWSLAGSTFVTAFFCIVFVVVEHPLAVRASTVFIGTSATAMWAVLYGWTPEIFGTKVRGTACGIASALSRIGGMIAPMLGGALLMIDNSFPVYASIIIFLIAGACVLLLKENAGARGGSRVLAH